jgi:aminoglycoside N3'-acetyltransferase
VNPGELAYGLARRVLTQQRRDRINAGIRAARKQLSPLIARWHGTFGADELVRELERALPPQFDALMVHCSFDDLLPMYTGGVAKLLEALRHICGPNRTRVMPAFTFHVPGGDLPTHFQKNPRFDLRRQPSQMGLLLEVFRRTPHVARSLHPTHSVCALGPSASTLTSGHELARTTFGEGTPFVHMAKIDTAILGLGKPFYRVLTQTHVPEDLLGDRFPVPREFREVDITLVDARGDPYHFRIDVTRTQRQVHRLRRTLARGDLTEWQFHGVPMFWTRAERATRPSARPPCAGERSTPALRSPSPSRRPHRKHALRMRSNS